MTQVVIRDESLQTLKEQVIIITGGSSGIGLATVSQALELGAKVVVGDLNAPPADVAAHANLAFVPVNVTSWAALSGLFEKAVELHGRIDHVFANAGIAPRTINLFDSAVDDNGKLLEPDHTVFDVNLKSVVNTTALALHYLKQQPSGGSIVLTASATSFQPFPAIDYGTAKTALLGLLRNTTALLASTSSPPLRVNAIAPDWTATAMVSGPAVRRAGAAVMAPDAPARSALLLMAERGRRGQLVYSRAKSSSSSSSSEGVVEYTEIDAGLRQAARLLTGADEAGAPDLGVVLARVRGQEEEGSG